MKKIMLKNEAWPVLLIECSTSNVLNVFNEFLDASIDKISRVLTQRTVFRAGLT